MCMDKRQQVSYHCYRNSYRLLPFDTSWFLQYAPVAYLVAQRLFSVCLCCPVPSPVLIAPFAEGVALLVVEIDCVHESQQGTIDRRCVRQAEIRG